MKVSEIINGMKHGSLFSGIGGWSVASDQMGWDTLFCCEWDENKQYELNNLWPDAEIYGDITKTDFSKWRGIIDILTASTPCQPFSLAGKRGGSDDVRHLWPETHRAIRELQPQWFVLENVPGLVNWSKGMVFKQIISDLENEGYEVLPFLLPACGVNAPHKRERIWVVAHSGKGRIKQEPEREWRKPWEGWPQMGNELAANDKKQFIADPSKQGQQERQSDNGRTDTEENRSGMDNRPERLGNFGTFANSDSSVGREGRMYQEGRKKAERHIGPCNSWNDKSTNWLNFPTVSPLRTGDDGFSRDALRSFINENSGGLLTEKEVDQIIQKSLNKWNNETIAAGGDAVVPGVVLQIFKAIEQYSHK